MKGKSFVSGAMFALAVLFMLFYRGDRKVIDNGANWR